MNNTNDTLVEYSSGDQFGIVNLHNDVFKSNLNVHRWNWQFLKHPRGSSWITISKNEGEVVGHQGIMRHHLNFIGQEIVAGQSCNTMVREDQRGKKLFIKLAKRNFEFASIDGVKAVFGFPNKSSYYGFIRKLDWIKIFNLAEYQYRIGYDKLFGRIVNSIAKEILSIVLIIKLILYKIIFKNISIYSNINLPSNLDDILNNVNNYEVLSTWKDEEYLKWRYENHPDNKYTFHVLKNNNVIDELIITRYSNDEISICEVISRNKNINQSVLLLLHIKALYVRKDVRKIIFKGHDAGFFDLTFHNAGFKKSISNFRFCGRVFDDDKLKSMFYLPSNWSISLGDTDVI